ncbi:hypothetical protein HMPREF3158_05530 [Corynebacterium sp. HMSC06G04]|nr:hypothetical protein HMPREF3158_05530 [Corynebacterium sp. HMSC06G04]
MRDFAQIKLSIWNDDAFLDLSNNAQLLYFVLISHPTMNRAGVGTWHAGRLSGMCSTWTRQDVERAACELIDGRFIVVDEDTDEFLVRTFVRHDGLMKQRNLATTMAREFAAVGSRAIKGVVVWELRRLHEEHPEFKGWGSDEALALLKKRAIDPSSDPSVDPSIDPSVDPSVYPSIHPSIDPRVKGAVDPWVDPSIDPSVDPSVDPRVKGEPKGSVDPSVDPSPTTATTTTTFSRRSQRVETWDGVEGVRGRRGNQTTANDTTGSDASNPPPESLDELAAAYAARTRCPKHRHIPDGEWVDEPCRECQKLREGSEAEDARAAEAEKEARRAAIDACDLCDGNGMRYEGGEAWRCDHNLETHSIHGPAAPQSDKQHADGQSPQTDTPTPQKRKQAPF